MKVARIIVLVLLGVMVQSPTYAMWNGLKRLVGRGQPAAKPVEAPVVAPVAAPALPTPVRTPTKPSRLDAHRPPALSPDLLQQQASDRSLDAASTPSSSPTPTRASQASPVAPPGAVGSPEKVPGIVVSPPTPKSTFSDDDFFDSVATDPMERVDSGSSPSPRMPAAAAVSPVTPVVSPVQSPERPLKETGFLSTLVFGDEVDQEAKKVYKAKDFEGAKKSLDLLSQQNTEGSYKQLQEISQASDESFKVTGANISGVRRYAHMLLIKSDINNIKDTVQLSKEDLATMCQLFEYLNHDEYDNRDTIDLARQLFASLNNHANRFVRKFYQDVLLKLYQVMYVKTSLNAQELDEFKAISNVAHNKSYSDEIRQGVRRVISFVVNNHPVEMVKKALQSLFAPKIQALMRGRLTREQVKPKKLSHKETLASIDTLLTAVMDATDKDEALSQVELIIEKTGDEFHIDIRNKAQEALMAIAQASDEEFTGISGGIMGMFGGQEQLSAQDKNDIRAFAGEYLQQLFPAAVAKKGLKFKKEVTAQQRVAALLEKRGKRARPAQSSPNSNDSAWSDISDEEYAREIAALREKQLAGLAKIKGDADKSLAAKAMGRLGKKAEPVLRKKEHQAEIDVLKNNVMTVAYTLAAATPSIDTLYAHCIGENPVLATMAEKALQAIADASLDSFKGTVPGRVFGNWKIKDKEKELIKKYAQEKLAQLAQLKADHEHKVVEEADRTARAAKLEKAIKDRDAAAVAKIKAKDQEDDLMAQHTRALDALWSESVAAVKAKSAETAARAATDDATAAKQARVLELVAQLTRIQDIWEKQGTVSDAEAKSYQVLVEQLEALDKEKFKMIKIRSSAIGKKWKARNDLATAETGVAPKATAYGSGRAGIVAEEKIARDLLKITEQDAFEKAARRTADRERREAAERADAIRRLNGEETFARNVVAKAEASTRSTLKAQELQEREAVRQVTLARQDREGRELALRVAAEEKARVQRRPAAGRPADVQVGMRQLQSKLVSVQRNIGQLKGALTTLQKSVPVR